ncbi:MAG: hypothetical protein OIF40_07860 [Mangrovicoccus sp.]|nr:hypothetical protein [Mangrovicoccus sp.]
MSKLIIKDSCADDIPGLQEVLEATGLFPAEMLPDMLAPSLAGESGAHWLSGIANLFSSVCELL